MNSNNLYKKTEQYVTDLFSQNQDASLVFHNIDHTRTVVERTKEIAGHYALTENDMLAVYVAAWFHDTGYLFTDPAHHEEKSVELMRAFMKTQTSDEKLLDQIEACIIATRQPRRHDNLLEEIICDADTYHLGTKEFRVSNKKVWEEFNNKGNALSEKEWAVKTIELLSEHRFYTKYCKDKLEDKKHERKHTVGSGDVNPPSETRGSSAPGAHQGPGRAGGRGRRGRARSHT